MSHVFSRLGVRLVAALAATILIALSPPRAAAQDCGVQPGFAPGITPIYQSGNLPFFTSAMYVYDDGFGPALYTTRIGTAPAQSDLPATSVVRLHNKRWERVGYLCTGAISFGSGDLGANLPGGPRLFVGGSLSVQNSATTPGAQSAVAMWDGQRWQAIPNIGGSTVSLVVFDDGFGGGPQLYAAAGPFSGFRVNGTLGSEFARWNGHVWQNIDHSLPGHPTQLGVYDMGNGPHLYAGGVGATGLARWTGTQWVEAGSSATPIYAQSMAYLNGPNGPEIVFGGGVTINSHTSTFGRIDAAGNIAGIDVPLRYFGRQPFVAVSVTDRLGPSVYLGGGQPTSLGYPVGSCYRYDGTTVAAVAATTIGSTTNPYDPQNTFVSSIAQLDDGDGGQIYGAGWIGACGDPDEPASNFARTRSMFRIPQTGPDAGHVLRCGDGLQVGGPIFSDSHIGSTVLEVDGREQLVVYGPINSAGSSASLSIALFDGQHWTPYFPSPQYVGSFQPTVVQTALVRGELRLVSNQTGFYSTEVSDFHAGISGAVPVPGTLPLIHLRTLLYFDDFTTDGPALYSQSDTHVERAVNGQSQTILSLPEIQTLAVCNLGQGPQLFVGARFPDGPGIALWNGATWDRVGPPGGFATVPTTLIAHDDGDGPRLYASFESSAVFQGQTAYRIARFNADHWEPVDLGLTGGGGVRTALANFDDGTGPALYAAGDFTAAGGLPSRGFARLRNHHWEPYLDINPRPGIDGHPIAELSLSVLGDTMYLVGAFADTGLRPPGAPTNTESNVIQAENLLAIRACPPACFPDLNHDGAIDQGDVDYLINAAAGADNPTGANLDLNNDDVTDQGDVNVLIDVVAGGNCGV